MRGRWARGLGALALPAVGLLAIAGMAHLFFTPEGARSIDRAVALGDELLTRRDAAQEPTRDRSFQLVRTSWGIPGSRIGLPTAAPDRPE